VHALHPIRASVTVPQSAAGGQRLVVSVQCSTDAAWKDARTAQGDSPKTPQTHMVRARTDPSWFGRNGPYLVQGTPVVRVVVGTLSYAASCDEGCVAATASAAAAHPAPQFHQGVRRSSSLVEGELVAAAAAATAPGSLHSGLAQMPLLLVGAAGCGWAWRKWVRRPVMDVELGRVPKIEP
jgi:hypothetical protein